MLSRDRLVRIRQWAASALLLIPFIAYAYYVLRYATNVPYWDDYDSILGFMNNFLSADGLAERSDLMFSQHNEHRLVVSRLVSVMQHGLFQDVNLKLHLCLGNLGWVLTTAVVAAYAGRRLGLPMVCLLPIPWLLLSVAHWHAMFFAMAAIQSYWSILFAMVFLIAATERRVAAMCILFPAMLLTSGGGIVLYPIGNVVLWSRTRRRAALIFLAVSTACLLLYLYGYERPSEHPALAEVLSHPGRAVQYYLVFWGGAFTTKPLALVVGSITCLAALRFVIDRRCDRFLRLLTSFVALIALVVSLTRSGFGVEQAMEPRYAMYSLLGWVALYLLIVSSASTPKQKIRISLVGSICAVAFWARLVTLFESHDVFANIRDQRLASVAALRQGDPSLLLYPDPARAAQTLLLAKQLGVYDFETAAR